MKLIIDIPEEIYNDIQLRDWKNGELIFSEEWKAIHNGTPITNNTTNGDVIHGLYMPYGYVVNDDYDEVIISAKGVDMRFSKTWWNTPYRKGGKG